MTEQVSATTDKPRLEVLYLERACNILNEGGWLRWDEYNLLPGWAVEELKKKFELVTEFNGCRAINPEFIPNQR